MNWEETEDRQKVINEYLAETGSDVVWPGEFVDWLEAQPEHEMHDALFGKSAEDAAWENRIEILQALVDDRDLP